MRALVWLSVACLVACGGGQSPGRTSPSQDAGGGGPDAGGATKFTLKVQLSGKGTVLSSPQGIDCGSGCGASFETGTSVTLSATALSGEKFVGWSGACSGNGTCTVAMTADESVTASFAVPGSLYTIVELPPAEGVVSLRPTGVNAHGDVVGTYDVPPPQNQPPMHSFLYDAATRTTRRISFDGSFEEAATGINDNQQVSVSDNGMHFTGYRWQNGVLTDIGSLSSSDPESGGDAVNAQGWVAGWSTARDNVQHAVFWDGTLHDLGTLNGRLSIGLGLNARGVVVGFASAGSGTNTHAAVFSGGTVRDLGTLGGAQSSALAINDNGRGVGWSLGGVPPNAADVEHGFVHDLPNGPMRDIWPGQSTRLVAVNAAGDAVGSTLDITRGQNRAIVWRNGVVLDLTQALNDPSWVLLAATAINASGQIAGFGVHGNEQHAFVLTPR